jgi:UDP-N-acetylmuramyl pentapeptide phosphotransferase/UDP-N-acetylglucosamine-1-phosphate transferase
MITGIWQNLGQLIPLAAAAAIGCAVLILVLRPFLARYAMARPNARSSHRMPTPQGGGIAVIGATTLVIAVAMILEPALFGEPRQVAIVFAAALALAIVGVTDDIRPLEALPRLVLQTAAVAVVIAALPATLRVIPQMPWGVERALLLLGGIWFVNLVNFMDGIDWMTIAEIVPMTAALAAFGLAGALPADATVVAAVLCGAMLGFAPFNKPVARLFLGDVGSLPIGLLVAWLLASLAGSGHLIAALLLPLYYLADATITVLRRLMRGEPVTQAHRSHFYQRAVDRGRGVYRIVGPVFAVNVLLAGLGAVSLRLPAIYQLATMFVGLVVVSVLLWDMGRKPQQR